MERSRNAELLVLNYSYFSFVLIQNKSNKRKNQDCENFTTPFEKMTAIISTKKGDHNCQNCCRLGFCVDIFSLIPLNVNFSRSFLQNVSLFIKFARTAGL